MQFFFYLIFLFFLLEVFEPCDVLQVLNTCQYDDTTYQRDEVVQWCQKNKNKKIAREQNERRSDTFSINIKHYKHHKGIIELSV